MQTHSQNFLMSIGRRCRRTRISFTAVGLVWLAGTTQMSGQSTETTSMTSRMEAHVSAEPSVHVRIDSIKHEAVITVAPLRIPAATSYNHHFAPAPVPFIWPVTGFVQGFRIQLLDSSRRVLPREVLHHAGVTNLDRRQLPYPLSERLFAAGTESEAVALPGSLGVPLSQGSHMLAYFALANSASSDLVGVTLEIRMPWKAEGGKQPRPVLPMYFDVMPNIGAPNTFDAAPGRSVTSSEFVLPAAGHLRYLGGHLHQYGVELRLEDAATNKVLARLRSERNADGTVRSVQRQRFYFRRNGLRLRGEHRYRIVAVYDNPTCVPASGSMGLLVAIFAPDDLAKWPAVDVTNVDYQKDLAWFLEAGAAEAGEAHDHGMEISPATSPSGRCGP